MVFASLRRWWGMRSRWWTSWTTPTSSSCTLPLSPVMTSSWSWSSKSLFLHRPLSSVGTTEGWSAYFCSVEGGELFDRIIDENYNLTELDTVLFIRQICEGLRYMHKMYILHLDLKVPVVISILVAALTFCVAVLISLAMMLLFCCVSAREHSVCQQSYKQNQNHWFWPGKEVRLISFFYSTVC